MIGKTLAHYKIVGSLGKGGMGEVYLAEDTKLGREVALKLLPEDLASDSERLERFGREAKAIAALNHPNIVTIHSVEEVPAETGTMAMHLLVMERVEGKSLDQVLPASGFDLERLLSVAAQIAGALAAAHAAGITHRDLKPANLMVNDEGRVKVLDFGLAKVAEGQPPAEEETQLLTGDGMILGTVPYMSPEQVQGQPVDSRSDIFSFGILLYEMATGERPFRGDNPASVISAVLREKPALVTGLRDELPNHLGRIVRRCLEKLPHNRYQSARDVQLEFEGLANELASGAGSATSQVVEAARTPLARAPRARWVFVALGAFLLGAVASFVILAQSRTDSMPDPSGLSLTQITDFAGSQAFPSLSPDGRQIVYAATRAGHTDLHLLRIGGDNPINLTRGSKADNTQPAFSPDGESIAFRSERQGGGLFVMGATGESVRRLTDFGFHASWSPDGREIAFSTDRIDDPAIRAMGQARIAVFNLASGELREIPVEGDASQPVWSPDGKRIAYWGLFPGTGQRDLWTMAVNGADPIRLTDDTHLDWYPVWSADGRFLYFVSDRGGSRDLWRLPIDQESGAAIGPPEPITVGAGILDHPAIDASGGRLAFVSQFRRDRLDFVGFDPTTERLTGSEQTLIEAAALTPFAWLSEDGERLLYWAAAKNDALIIERLDGSERSVLVQDKFRNRTPAWCNGDQIVLFGSDRGGGYEIWSISTDGSDLHQLTQGSDSAGGALVPRCAEGTDTFYFNEMGTGPAVAHLEDGTISERQQLAPLPGGGTGILFDLSPDQTRLVGAVWDEGSSTGLVVYDIASEKYRVVDIDAVPIGSAFGRWFSDNRRVAVMLAGSLKIFDTESMEVRDVEGTPTGSIGVADISRDDRQILIRRSTTNDNVWLLDL